MSYTIDESDLDMEKTYFCLCPGSNHYISNEYPEMFFLDEIYNCEKQKDVNAELMKTIIPVSATIKTKPCMDRKDRRDESCRQH